VLHEFEGGNGEIGLHGTNEPWAVGTDVSHGCIRVYNSVITRLAHELPLGTPVRIAP
jgi:lipoprotein-anchoring transpeptidase ErfK/SrfK